jgi:4-hydroxythreonine-4-phosphate dehydrogenase
MSGKKKEFVPRFIITPGDFRGIGPEITAKALSDPKIRSLGQFLIIGDLKSYSIKFRNLKLIQGPPPQERLAKQILYLRIQSDAKDLETAAGEVSFKAFDRAIGLAKGDDSTAMVTGPISKDAWQKAGFSFTGHTELLAERYKQTPVMMLANSKLRVCISTTHVSLKEVSQNILKEKLLSQIGLIANELKKKFGIESPKIAVLGLNPHCGENGLFGREELDQIIPAIHEAQSFARVTGPHPADTFFALELLKKKSRRHDVILAMYHDQGLCPVKMVDFFGTVNISLGISGIRTSVDHGTAIDIAGQNCANPKSLKEAILLASDLLIRQKSQN